MADYFYSLEMLVLSPMMAASKSMFDSVGSVVAISGIANEENQ